METSRAADFDTYNSFIPRSFEVPGDSRRINIKIPRYMGLGLTKDIKAICQVYQ
jgi:hypothetical protein